MLISSMIQTTEKWDSLVLRRADFLMAKSAMVFCVFIFIFLFRSNGKKSTWMNDFCHFYGNYFENVILKVTWYQLFSKLLTTARHIDNGAWKTSYSWKFYGHGTPCILILSWKNMMRQKWAKVPWKLSAAQKSDPVIWRT